MGEIAWQIHLIWKGAGTISLMLYPQMTAAFEEQVVRWEWTSKHRYSHRPHHFERSGTGRGRILEEEQPSELMNTVIASTVSTAQDRVIVERFYVQAPDPNQSIEALIATRKTDIIHISNDTYFEYEDDLIYEVEFMATAPTKLPRQVGCLILEDGRPASYCSLTVDFGPQVPVRTADGLFKLLQSLNYVRRLEEHYTYSDDQLTAVKVISDNPAHSPSTEEISI